MSALAVFVPFDLFGSPGASAGAHLLADAVREMAADNRRERQPTRAVCYRDHLRIKELAFETPAEIESWRSKGRSIARAALNRGDFLLWIGGNHLSVLPVLEELGTKSLVFQLDAHLDVYNLTDCTPELSHGNFLLHAQEPLPPIVHIGHRDLFLPNETIAKHFRATFSSQALGEAPERTLRELAGLAKNPKRIWIDLDCDAIDPAYFPAVDGPLPFGLSPPMLLRVLDAVWNPRVAGVSISEFVPARDRADQSLGLLVWLIEWLLLKRYENIRSDEEE